MEERQIQQPTDTSSGAQPLEEHGQNLVELMIAMMLMLYLIIGVLDLGRALHAYTVLVQAARETAFVAASTATGLDHASAIFQDELSRGGLSEDNAQVSIQVESSGTPPRPTVVVEASYTLPLLLPLTLVDVTVSTQAASLMVVPTE